MWFLLSGLATTLLLLAATIEAWTVSQRSSTVLRMSVTNDVTLQTAAPSSPLSRSGHNPEAWRKTFTTCPSEVPPTTLDCPDLPQDFPVGTYYRNGHGRFEADDGMQCYHMFDGDGLVSAVTFDPSQKKILFRNRFVRTAGYVLDKKTGTMSKPGVFGTQVSGGWIRNLFRLDFKNVANTHVLYNGGNLYALWEAGWPYLLDSLTLENDVVAEPEGHNLDGQLKQGENFAAHYRLDALTGSVVNFGVNLNPAKDESKVNLYEFDANMKSIRSDEVSFIYKGPVVAHDFALTENWNVFVIPPASLDQQKILGSLLGRDSIADAINFYTNALETTVVLVPRMKDLEMGTASSMRVGDDTRIKTIQVPYHFNFHFSNAFEDEDGNVIIDSVLSEEAELGTSLSKDVPIYEQADLDDYFPTKYVRFSVNPQLGSIVPGSAPQTISTRSPEFPSVPQALSSRKHRYAYSVGSHRSYKTKPDGRGMGAAGAVLKLDTEQPEKNEAYGFLPHEFVGEVVFCPKVGADLTQSGSEDKGYLVSYVVNGLDLTTDMVIFDAEGEGKLEEGPVARVRLPTFIPAGLHGTFVEGLTFEM